MTVVQYFVSPRIQAQVLMLSLQLCLPPPSFFAILHLLLECVLLVLEWDLCLLLCSFQCTCLICIFFFFVLFSRSSHFPLQRSSNMLSPVPACSQSLVISDFLFVLCPLFWWPPCVLDLYGFSLACLSCCHFTALCLCMVSASPDSRSADGHSSIQSWIVNSTTFLYSCVGYSGCPVVLEVSLNNRQQALHIHLIWPLTGKLANP